MDRLLKTGFCRKQETEIKGCRRFFHAMCAGDLVKPRNFFQTKTGALEHPFCLLELISTPTYSTKKSRIMPMSSCSRLWQ